MRILKRAFLSITKKKVRTVLLFLIIAAVVTMALTGISISMAADKSADLARQKLGSSVTLSINNENMMERPASGSSSQQPRQITPVTQEIAQKLITLDHVAAYNYTVTGMAQSDTVDCIQTVTQQNEVASTSSTGSTSSTTGNDRGFSGPGGENGGGGGRMFQMDSAQFMVMGVLEATLETDFQEGSSKITSGRAITASDAGTNVVMIETHLAEENDLKVGSKIQFESVSMNSTEDGEDNTTTVTLEVVGIYETSNTPNENDQFGASYNNPYNKIYTPLKAASSLQMRRIDSDTSVNAIDSAIYYLDDPANLDAFQAAAANVDIDWDAFKLDANDTAYKMMTGPIDNVASFANLIVILAAVAGVIILTLILILAMKERTYEVGVLLSLGERKRSIAVQMLAEVLIIAVFSFAVATCASYFIADSIGNQLIQNEISVNEEQQQENPYAMQGRGGMGKGLHAPGSQQQNVEQIDSIDVSIGGKELGVTAGATALVILLAVAIPVGMIMTKKPREILIRHG